MSGNGEAALDLSPTNDLEFRALVSELVTRAKLAGRAGLTFGGLRDLYETLGYSRVLTLRQLRDRYERGGVAARVVEVLPRGTWRGGAELINDEDVEKTTPFEQAWEDLDKRLSLWSAFLRADILAGLGQYSVLLLGAPGELNTPLPKLNNPEKLVYVTPYCQEDATIQKLVEDPKDPRYGLPLTYELKRSSKNYDLATAEKRVTDKQRSFVVHFSRVIHVSDGTLDDDVYGSPRLRRVWNLFDDLEKVTGAGSEAFWMRVHQGFHFDLDKDLQFNTPGEADKFRDAVDEYIHGLRRVITTRGTKLDVLGSNVATIVQNVDSILKQIAGAVDIPLRILVGSERGELASSQDASEFDDRIEDRRKEWAEPKVVRPFVTRLVEAGALPDPGESWRVNWPELKKTDEKGQADIATIWADLNKKTGDIVVTAAEIRDKCLNLPALTEEQLAEEEEKKAAKLEEQQMMMQSEAEAKAGAGQPPGGFRGAAAPLPKGQAQYESDVRRLRISLGLPV